MNERSYWIGFYEDLGYTDVRLMPDGSYAGLGAMIFTVGIVVGLEPTGYRGRYCYPDRASALCCFRSMGRIRRSAGRLDQIQGQGRRAPESADWRGGMNMPVWKGPMPTPPLSPTERTWLTTQDRRNVDAWRFQMQGMQPAEHDLLRLYILGKEAGYFLGKEAAKVSHGK